MRPHRAQWFALVGLVAVTAWLLVAWRGRSQRPDRHIVESKVRVGMTLAQAGHALGMPLRPEADAPTVVVLRSAGWLAWLGTWGGSTLLLDVDAHGRVSGAEVIHDDWSEGLHLAGGTSVPPAAGPARPAAKGGPR